MPPITKEVPIDAKKYNQIREISVEGATIKGALSPYDFPHHATAVYDEKKKEYAIHFKYLTPDEERSEVPVAKEISLFVGKNSGKLYDVIVRGQEPHGLRQFNLQLVSGVKQLEKESREQSPKNYVAWLNLQATERILAEADALYSAAG
jgi:hypothetical protein